MKIRLWKGPKQMNFFASKACVIAGIVIIFVEVLFEDKTGIYIGLFVLIGGSALYGIQGLAWKQWENRKAISKQPKDN